MAITVYWTVLDKEWMRAKEPQPVLKNLYEKRLHEETPMVNYHRCPFVHDHLSNTFSLHSPYDYSFSVDQDNKVVSSMYNQEFFDRHVFVRSAEKRLFSFFMPFVFFTEEKSLEATIRFPYMENNTITQRCMPFEGTIDIGRYFRIFDFAFFLKEPFSEFVISEDEIFLYLNFNTKKKIKFVRFYPTEKINKYSDDTLNMKINRKLSFSSLDFFYNNFHLKKNIMKEIKNNIVE